MHPVGTQHCFNIVKWLKSSFNFDQPLYNVESTLKPNPQLNVDSTSTTQLIYNVEDINVKIRFWYTCINGTEYIFLNLNFLIVCFIYVLLILCKIEALKDVFLQILIWIYLIYFRIKLLYCCISQLKYHISFKWNVKRIFTLHFSRKIFLYKNLRFSCAYSEWLIAF